MKTLKIFIMAGLLFSFPILSALEFELENADLFIEEAGDHTVIGSPHAFNTSNTPGCPAIPVAAFYFGLEPGQRIAQIEITPLEIREIELDKPVVPGQTAIPLSSSGPLRFTDPDPFYYQENSDYPRDLVYNYGSGWCGDFQVGYIAYYIASYNAVENVLKVPAAFRFRVITQTGRETDPLPPGNAANMVLKKLGLRDNPDRDDVSYLLITPEIFLADYQPLLDWREKQGLTAYSITIEEIGTEYEGIDLQEKVRNCILDYYTSCSIDYVTLGSDVSYIPDRKVFAFDCQYGAYQDENEIPSDMYFSCLNGNWDANGNQIYGEDEDETDFFPEVFVARIPANDNEEIEDFLARLIDYEQGLCPEYNKAGGFSMELWEGSNSEVCQQYIYDQYFPGYYDINFLYGVNNNEENAYDLMNQNQNILQHTGHAGRNSLSLESGRINNQNIDQLQNEYGGLFYSIGCWSAAIDYSSIGEKLQISPGKGQLGYIGNSRYGWGAPSAPGFGFSEFFQKEYFRNLFLNEIDLLAQANALQKIPFIAYYDGVSVYKWVAYELNALGDSYFRLNLDNPQPLAAELDLLEDFLLIQLNSGGLPVENAVISTGEIRLISNINGEAEIDINDLGDTVSIYKRGHRSLILDSGDLPESILIGDISGNEQENGYLQGESLTVSSRLINNTGTDYSFSVEYSFEHGLLTIENEGNPQYIEPYGSVDLGDVDVLLNLVSAENQLEDGAIAYLGLEIIDQDNYEMITSTSIPIQVRAPDLDITSIFFIESGLEPGIEVPVAFQIGNLGQVDASGLTCNFISQSEYLSFADESYSLFLYLPAGGSIELENVLLISPDLPLDHIMGFTVELITAAGQNTYLFENMIEIPAGEISFSEDFETGLSWSGDPDWQTVDTYSYNGQFSLSCRPGEVGMFETVSSDYSYYPEQVLSFWYRYKMPMYGEDGVYFILEHDASADTLLFLGAGGALHQSGRPIEAYIESGWDQFQLPLAEILIEPPELGTLISFRLVFKYAEEIPGFNQYALMDEIGVFIDELELEPLGSEISENEDPVMEPGIQIYPNPVMPGSQLKIMLDLPDSDRSSAEIYNLKGQKIRTVYSGFNPGPGSILYWDGRDRHGRQAGSGIYFLRLKSGGKESLKKFVILK